jgi:hypothetical protein
LAGSRFRSRVMREICPASQSSVPSLSAGPSAISETVPASSRM